MVPRKKHTVQDTAAVGDGIRARQNTREENAHANTRNEDDTHNWLRGNGDADAEDTKEVEKQEADHPEPGQRRGTEDPIDEQGQNKSRQRKEAMGNAKYVKNARAAEIAKLIRQNQEMPEKLDQTRDDRKKLAAIILAFPPRSRRVSQ